MTPRVEIVSVDAGNLATRGFFCRKSKMKTPGNQRKLAWSSERFDEGLGIAIVYDDGRSVGFIERVFGIVLDGELLGYHYLLEEDVVALLADRG